MKIIPNEENIINKPVINFISIGRKLRRCYNSYIIRFICLMILFAINDFIIIILFKNPEKIKSNISFDVLNHSNIDLNDDFFKLKDVQEKIKINNLTYIQTLFGERTKVGNALILLNNLINVCENIGCKNIISPSALKNLIKKPIYYKEYNITIFPYSYKKRIKIDIELDSHTIYHFRYMSKPHKIRLDILRDEIFNNIPKYNGNPNDLIIKLRSGDIFINRIDINYSQPPLCFYKKIINENKFNKIYILSNGHENPVVDELLKFYHEIIYLEGTLEEAISIIVNAYNLVLPISTFPMTLIWMNNNLRNLFIYELGIYKLRKYNYTLHKMKPSNNYIKLMKHNWKNTKEQKDLMLKENCTSSKMTSFLF